MAQRLRDIRPGEVSLVHRGANKRRFLLAKAEGELDPDIAEIFAAPVEKEAALLDVIREAGGDESVEKAAAAFARARAALTDAYGGKLPAAVAKEMADLDSDGDTDGDEPGEDDETIELAKAYEELLKEDAPTEEQRQEWAKQGIAMPDGSYYIRNRSDLDNAIHAIGRGKSPHSDIRAHIVTRARALGATDALPKDWNVTKEDKVTETAHAVPVKKEDGTWDLSAVPEDQRAGYEALLKAHDDEIDTLRKETETEKAEAIAKAEEATKIAKAERDARERRDHIAKSETFTHLAKDDEEFGGVLLDIFKAERDEHLPAGTLEKVESVLKAANEAVEKGALFAEIGRHGGAPSDAEDKLEKAAAALRDADPSLTKPQSIAKALDNDPDLYTEIRKEQA